MATRKKIGKSIRRKKQTNKTRRKRVKYFVRGGLPF